MDYLFGNSTDLSVLFSYVTDVVPRAANSLMAYMDDMYDVSIFQWIYPKIGPYSIDGRWFFPPLLEAGIQPPWYFNAFFMTILSAIVIAFLPLIALAALYRISGNISRGKSNLGESLLSYFLSFAAGSLLADVALHLLPDLFGGHEGDARISGAGLLFGILSFWMLEFLSPHDHHGHGGPEPGSPVLPAEPRTKSPLYDTGDSDFELLSESDVVSSPKSRRRRPKKPTAGRAKSKSQTHLPRANKASPSLLSHFSQKIWIQLLADALHNFCDGLALSAAWLRTFYPGLGSYDSPLHGHHHHHHHHCAVSDRALGLTTTIAILLHELPHNVSDILLLLHLGKMTPGRAFLTQFLTGLCVLLGAVTGLFIGAHAGTLFQWILPFSTGGFLYLALAVILPSLTHASLNRMPLSLAASFVSGVLFIYLCSH